MLLGGYGDVCQWVGQSSVTVCVRICEWVYWEGPFWEWIGVCMCESVCVSVFGWGALMYVCVGAGDLWGVSVFVRVGGGHWCENVGAFGGVDGRVDIVCA